MRKNTLLICVIGTCVSIIGGIYLYYNMNNVDNEYNHYQDEETITVNNWTPGVETPKNLKVTNEEKVEVATRIKCVESWTAVDGTALDGYSNGEKVAQFDIGDNWVLGTDGYYYYQKTLKPGEETTYFINSVIFNPNFELVEGRDIICAKNVNESTVTATCKNTASGYNGATYKLSFIIETVQSDLNWSYERV